mmetsp:Transcript_45902/g.73485  ORF Transcript_45902/g.73485 Transcript_45902/m.73485 type:complete len:202 (+) Transcript_45902:152-757(+)
MIRHNLTITTPIFKATHILQPLDLLSILFIHRIQLFLLLLSNHTLIHPPQNPITIRRYSFVAVFIRPRLKLKRRSKLNRVFFKPAKRHSVRSDPSQLFLLQQACIRLILDHRQHFVHMLKLQSIVQIATDEHDIMLENLERIHTRPLLQRSSFLQIAGARHIGHNLLGHIGQIALLLVEIDVNLRAGLFGREWRQNARRRE